MYEVAGKTAVVTGAASGIGLGMARVFAAAGMSVVLADIEQERLDEAVTALRGSNNAVIGVRTDVTVESQLENLRDAALAEFGAVHVVANNAGIGTGGPIEQMSLDDWRWTLDVNLWGVIYGVRAFLPLLKEQGEGHITATSSMAGLLPGPVLGAYHVSKHAVVGLMDSLRVELEMAHSEVRASVLCPGAVNTNVTRSARNRPTHLSEHVSSPLEDKFWVNLTNGLAGGMDPDAVGEIVLDAVRHERFWILTHPDQYMPMLEKRLASLRSDNADRMT